MVKFAHLADCHLGGWRQEELQNLNFRTFQAIVARSIQERVEFMLISGDLFDSAYPAIEILKETFSEFKKLHDAKIPVYLIAGSHDFSASGKTFLDVLEKAGFCKNVENSEVQEDGRIKLTPHFHGDIAIFGYPGRKSGMEIEDLRKVYFDSVYPFTIFMIHTTIKDVVGTIPIDSLEKSGLPLANYYAMGHIHQIFEAREANSHYVYPGPTFPNNFQELTDLKCGSFQLVEIENGSTKSQNIKIPLKEVAYLEINLDSGLTATDRIISELDKLNLRDKIALLKLKGTLLEGKSGDIRFNEIEEFVKKKEAYTFLRNISSIKVQDSEFENQSWEVDNVEAIEKQILGEYSKQNPADFNKYLPQLMNALSVEKNEGEKSAIFEDRLLGELKKTLEINKIM
ncbi:exonuclease SbcCD subunit D [archaeon]|jgi:DNA repair protein SbcD/Mre11|nr:exonuclease SbcCD subunit D [archaeon]MBT3578351.1 exonuclease SbcCD subunit D [archaeon]MBT6820267.1 exonuclease SbcCD subunit D [archaeon]MBT6956456.1 exonuclease SbcCD subunit D [archaeon]MBT7025714.1 exonuclease SbcCD subunit D [archaeon]